MIHDMICEIRSHISVNADAENMQFVDLILILNSILL